MSTHFLTGEELGRERLTALIERAAELKAGRGTEGASALEGRTVALVFERPSTRTRVSFEVGVAELGGTPVVLRGDELQLSRGESVADTARTLSRYVHAIAIRSGSHDEVAELAGAAGVPVINALTPLHHPCQALADLLTLRERFGELDGLRLAYVGDGNNVARSLAILGGQLGVTVAVASPAGYRLERGIAELTDDPLAAAAGADALYTDVWVSMGDEETAERRRSARRLGAITKTGSGHGRRLLVEAAWHYRRAPRSSAVLKRRQAGQPAHVVAISWQAQQRLHRTWQRLDTERGKRRTIVAVAVARELAGFCWATANAD